MATDSRLKELKSALRAVLADKADLKFKYKQSMLKHSEATSQRHAKSVLKLRPWKAWAKFAHGLKA
jgi:hypothetical protein